MRLLDLDLTGFKSFGDRTRLRFDPAFTAIVGPNGSGKSNLVDAIRWLLGEQSHKQLRTPDSAEILFQGEQAADRMNFSEVTMTLATGEGEEADLLHVGRRYERDGANHYLLNGQKSRLRDVRTTLAEQGFGLNAMSILSQGRIDAVLSLHPAERRVILEEVAQIHGFQVNKDKTLEKIAQTRDNLQRMEDVLREVTLRMAELAQQALAARRQAELLQRKAICEQALLARDLDRRSATAQQHQRDLRDAEAAVASYREQLVALQTEVQEAEVLAADLQYQLTAHLEQQAELAVRASEARNQAARQTEQAQTAQENLNALTRRQEALTARLHDLDALLAQSRTELEGLRDHAAEALRRRDEAQAALMAIQTALREREAAWQAARTARADLETQTQRLEREEAVAAAQIADLETSQTELTAALHWESDNLAPLEQAWHAAEVQAKDAERAWQAAQSRVTPAIEALQAVRDQLARIERELRELRDRRGDLAGEAKSLRTLADAHAGYEAGAQALLQAFPSELQPLLEAVQVQPGYELAAESAFGAAAQALVAPGWHQIESALQWLRNQGPGRALLAAPDAAPASLRSTQPASPPCMPLPESEPGDWRQVYAPAPPEASSPVSIPLRSVLTVPAAWTPLLDALCDGVVIVPDLTAARAQRSAGHAGLLVTREGELLHPWGGVTGGGAAALEGGVLARQARLGALDEQLAALDLQIAALDRAQQEARERDEAAQRELEAIRAGAQDARLRHTAALEAVPVRQRALEQQRAAITQLQQRKDNLQGRLAEAGEALATIRARLAALRNELTAAGDLAALEQEVSRLREDQAHAQQTSHETALRASELASSVANLERTLADATTERERLEAEDIAVRAEIAASENALAQITGLLPGLESAARTETETLEASRKEETRLRTTLQEARQQVAMGRSDLAGLQGDLAQAQGERESLQIRLARAEADAESLSAQVTGHPVLREQFPSLAEGIPTLLADPGWRAYVQTLAPVSQLKRELGEVEAELLELGEVNTLAARDYGHQEERQGTLQAQRQDLLDAIADLEASLKEIEQKSQQALEEVYERTRANFQEVFGVLFPGGEARLEWTDPEQILEAGLDIAVHFPGKGVRHLMQFSGGERTLIAIAFLFAVLQAKPPSFVILDEVEAALDDANVSKFLRLVDLFKAHFQFVVITHNKLTMEHAPLLYGVTMRPGGHSQVVSVRVQEWIAEHGEEPAVATVG